jgi:hypothetical protein
MTPAICADLAQLGEMARAEVRPSLPDTFPPIALPEFTTPVRPIGPHVREVAWTGDSWLVSLRHGEWSGVFSVLPDGSSRRVHASTLSNLQPSVDRASWFGLSATSGCGGIWQLEVPSGAVRRVAQLPVAGRALHVYEDGAALVVADTPAPLVAYYVAPDGRRWEVACEDFTAIPLPPLDWSRQPPLPEGASPQVRRLFAQTDPCAPPPEAAHIRPKGASTPPLSVDLAPQLGHCLEATRSAGLDGAVEVSIRIDEDYRVVHSEMDPAASVGPLADCVARRMTTLTMPRAPGLTAPGEYTIRLEIPAYVPPATEAPQKVAVRAVRRLRNGEGARLVSERDGVYIVGKQCGENDLPDPSPRRACGRRAEVAVESLTRDLVRRASLDGPRVTCRGLECTVPGTSEWSSDLHLVFALDGEPSPRLTGWFEVCVGASETEAPRQRARLAKPKTSTCLDEAR